MRRRREQDPENSPEAQLRRARERLEILEALWAAQDRRAEVFTAVCEAPSVELAVVAVQDLLGVGRHPAVAVLDTQLRRYTAAEREKLRDEREELRDWIRQLGG